MIENISLQSTPAAAMETMTGGPVESPEDQEASQQLMDELYANILKAKGNNEHAATQEMMEIIKKNVGPEKLRAINETHKYATAAIREEMAQNELRERNQQ